MQLIGFAQNLLEDTSDTFIYWLIPEHVSDEMFKEAYPQSDRIEYLRIPQSKDRILGYFAPPKELIDAVSFKLDYWDFDVLVTMRSGLVPMLKQNMNGPQRPMHGWMKQVWLLENMPLMAFKKSVPNPDNVVGDPFTVLGHMLADKVYIPTFHEKQDIIRAAQAHFTPSVVRKLDKKIKEVVITRAKGFKLKDPSQFPSEEKPFGISYCNRMEKGFQLELVNDIMIKKFIMNGDKVRLLVTTVSSANKDFDTNHVEIIQASQEEFWRMTAEDMHVSLFLPKGGALSMTLIEQMMAGTPVIIQRMPWLEKLFKGYPFFVTNETEAYGFVSMFMEDYAGTYAKWAAWMEEVFYPLMTDLFENNYLYDCLMQDTKDADSIVERVKNECQSWMENSMLVTIKNYVDEKGLTEFDFKSLLKEMTEAGLMEKDIYDLTFEPHKRDDRSLIFSLHPTVFRLAMKAFYGWEDASVKVGHMKKVGD